MKYKNVQSIYSFQVPTGKTLFLTHSLSNPAQLLLERHAIGVACHPHYSILTLSLILTHPPLYRQVCANSFTSPVCQFASSEPHFSLAICKGQLTKCLQQMHFSNRTGELIIEVLARKIMFCTHDISIPQHN